MDLRFYFTIKLIKKGGVAFFVFTLLRHPLLQPCVFCLLFAQPAVYFVRMQYADFPAHYR